MKIKYILYLKKKILLLQINILLDTKKVDIKLTLNI